MAVPKKRTGHSAQGHRRSNWKATKTEITTCTHCGQPALTHTVCAACGYYKDKAVSIKSSDYVEAVVETKAPAKKKAAAKPKAKKAETKVEVVEEVKVEETAVVEAEVVETEAESTEE